MAKTPLFSGLDMEETRKLGAFMYVYEAPSGVTIISEGEAGDFMMMLMQGMVDVLRRNRYNFPSRIAVAHAGHALGEMSMFDGEPRFASCVTLEQSRVAVLTRDALMLVHARTSPSWATRSCSSSCSCCPSGCARRAPSSVSYLEAAREA